MNFYFQEEKEDGDGDDLCNFCTRKYEQQNLEWESKANIRLKLKRIGITGRRRQRKATEVMSMAGRRNKAVMMCGDGYCDGGGGGDQWKKMTKKPVVDECDCAS